MDWSGGLLGVVSFCLV